MTYRDPLLTCPRCGKPLDRRARRETWPCHACKGVAIDEGELLRLLARVVPELGTAPALAFKPRAAAPALICAACHRPMTPVEMHGIPLDRCDKDELIWFDVSELDQLLDAVIADAEARKGWAQKLRDLLFAN